MSAMDCPCSQSSRWELGTPQAAGAGCELRVQCRLAWNNWPDSEASRKAIAEHEARDPYSAAAWDRVAAALQTAMQSPQGGAPAADVDRSECDGIGRTPQLTQPTPGLASK